MPNCSSPSSRRDRMAALFVIATALAAILFTAALSPVLVMRVSYQKTGEVILTHTVLPGDTVTVTLTHSFEHIPWNEYYTVLQDGSFLLKRIEVGGFGAGIPAEMDVPTYVGEDGLVHMDEINSVFPRFNWITSNINMKELLLNGQPILEFSEIPHHSFVTCEIMTQLVEDFGHRHNYLWQAGWNGRSSGYLVLYQGGAQSSKYRSYCTRCGQKNYTSVAETGKRCGVCNEEARVDYIKPPMEVFSYPGRGVDMDKDYEDWSIYELRQRTELVQEFDRLADDIVAEALYIARNHSVEERIIYVPTTKLVLA